MSFQKLAKFLMSGMFQVVCFLVQNIVPDWLFVRFTYGKSAISRLP